MEQEQIGENLEAARVRLKRATKALREAASAKEKSAAQLEQLLAFWALDDLEGHGTSDLLNASAAERTAALSAAKRRAIRLVKEYSS